MQLVIRNLSKTYPNGVHALHDVSLAIDRGMFGLLGPNGAGKSTLMRILATLQEADSGSARFGELDVLRDKDAVRRILGYLPQEFGLYPKVSAGDLLDHFALLKGVTNRRTRRELVDHLLHQTNLAAAKHKRLGGFSGGMRQRFGIAVALIGNPRLIIVDEPTAGLDPAERVRFLNLLSELGENAVVILSTHIVEDVSELCQRMAIIDRGHILLETEPLEALARLRGRVWRRIVEREQRMDYERRLPVISTRLLAGRTVIRVAADTAPDESWEPVEPDLEDVYFATMRRVPLSRETRPVEIAVPSISPARVDLAARDGDEPASAALADVPGTAGGSGDTWPEAVRGLEISEETRTGGGDGASSPAEPAVPSSELPLSRLVPLDAVDEVPSPTQPPISSSEPPLSPAEPLAAAISNTGETPASVDEGVPPSVDVPSAGPVMPDDDGEPDDVAPAIPPSRDAAPVLTGGLAGLDAPVVPAVPDPPAPAPTAEAPETRFSAAMMPPPLTLSAPVSRSVAAPSANADGTGARTGEGSGEGGGEPEADPAGAGAGR
jgi:ABC-type multidrug transport system ATPase subunit